MLVTWGLVFILLLAVIGQAFMPGGELFEYDDFPSTEGNTIAWAIWSFPTMSSLAFELGIFAMILFFEYLRGHIGEKRFSGWIIELNNSSFFAFFKTALYRAVFVFLFLASNRDESSTHWNEVSFQQSFSSTKEVLNHAFNC